MPFDSLTSYSDAVEFLYHLKPGKVAFGLSNTLELCAAMGNPQEGMKYIHIAGTNGKGSVAATLHSIFRSSGYRAGLFTSPHLVEFRERMKLDGEMISGEELLAGVHRLRAAMELLKKKGVEPTFFEATTALAFDWFKRKQVEIVILETGMGGRLDSTNIIVPEVSVITDIAFDHQQYLGNTLAKIAGEKAGIIKKGVPVFAAPAVDEVREVFESKARELGTTIEFVSPCENAEISNQPLGQKFVVSGEKYFSPLLGQHQLRNLALAIRVAHYLSEKGWRIFPETLQKGVSETSWPGRFHVLSRNPWLILDGGHNPQGLSRALETWGEVVGSAPRRIILGMLKDKEVSELGFLIDPLECDVWLVPIDSPRAAHPQDLAPYFKKSRTRIFGSVEKALEENHQNVCESGTLIVGSLYLAGEVLACIGQQTRDSRING